MLQNAAFVVAVCTFPNSLRFMDSTPPTMHTQFVSMNFVQFKKGKSDRNSPPGYATICTRYKSVCYFWYYRCGYNKRRTYCQVMTGITSSWISTVVAPFSSASTTCSWPLLDANIIAVQPSWSKMTITGASSDYNDLENKTSLTMVGKEYIFGSNYCSNEKWMHSL